MKRLENTAALKRLALAGVVLASLAGAFSPALRVGAQPPDASDPSNEAEAAPGAVQSATRSVGTRAPNTITGEGTAGNIAKFTGTHTIGNSVMIENAGKIGIGTATPASPPRLRH